MVNKIFKQSTFTCFLLTYGKVNGTYVWLFISKFQADFIEVRTRCFHRKATRAIESTS